MRRPSVILPLDAAFELRAAMMWRFYRRLRGGVFTAQPGLCRGLQPDKTPNRTRHARPGHRPGRTRSAMGVVFLS